MLLPRRARPAMPPAPDAPADLSHTLVPLTEAMPVAWPVHARRCLHRLPERLRWAEPVLDPDHPGPLDCTHKQARELVLWLNRLPSHEHPVVGCHRRRPA